MSTRMLSRAPRLRWGFRFSTSSRDFRAEMVTSRFGILYTRLPSSLGPSPSLSLGVSLEPKNFARYSRRSLLLSTLPPEAEVLDGSRIDLSAGLDRLVGPGPPAGLQGLTENPEAPIALRTGPARQ